MMPILNEEELIRSHADFFHVFTNSIKPESAFRIGPEAEKCGVFLADASPVMYEGADGISGILAQFIERYGWAPESESEGGPVIALQKNGASITLEPGGQLELSGKAVDNVHQVCAEFVRHMLELKPISEQLGIRWLGLGFQPFATRSDLSWVPKMRYGVMREYLPTRGAFALDMMLRTCTVQANFDYSSEIDAMRKMRVGLKLSPLTAAMFANSPFYEKKRSDALSMRSRVWLDVDNDRSGLIPPLWAEGSRFEDYVEWALDVPMFMLKRNGKKVANTGQTFRDFWRNGYKGHRASEGDWQTHLNTLFPEVRLKNTIEVRSADSQGPAEVCALPALWTGIYYDEQALNEAEAMAADWSLAEIEQLRSQVWRTALRTEFKGSPLVKVAEQLLEIAEGGLERRGRKEECGRDERVHLKGLKRLIARGMCPAEAILERLGDGPLNPQAIIKATDLGAAFAHLASE